MRLLADGIETIDLGGLSSTHLMCVVITMDRAIVTSNALEVVEARNEVVDIGCPFSTAAKVVKSALRLGRVLPSDSFSIDTFVSGGCSGDVVTYFDIARQR